jgi:hypothetical protein
VTLGTEINELAATTVSIVDASNNVVATRRVNTGDGSYVAVVRLDGAGGGTTGLVTQTHAFPPGLSLVSFPVRPLATDIAAGLGLDPTRFVLSFYDTPGRAYQTFAPGKASAAPLQPGRGYFLKTNADAGPTTVTVTGYAPPRDTDVTVSLPFGWNLVGMPFGADTDRIAVRDLTVQYLQNGTQSWEDAVANNLVAETPVRLQPGHGRLSAHRRGRRRARAVAGLLGARAGSDRHHACLPRARREPEPRWPAGNGRAAASNSRAAATRPRSPGLGVAPSGNAARTEPARPPWRPSAWQKGRPPASTIVWTGKRRPRSVRLSRSVSRTRIGARPAGTYLSDFRDPASVTRAAAPGLKGRRAALPGT